MTSAPRPKTRQAIATVNSLIVFPHYKATTRALFTGISTRRTTFSTSPFHRDPRHHLLSSSFVPKTSVPKGQKFFSSSSSTEFRSTLTNMVVHEVKNKANFDEALAGEGLVVLDCYATWCGPCKIISPMVDQFSESYSGASFYKLDVDNVADVAQELGVRAMPTFMLFKGGAKLKEVVGANPTALKVAIESNL